MGSILVAVIWLNTVHRRCSTQDRSQRRLQTIFDAPRWENCQLGGQSSSFLPNSHSSTASCLQHDEPQEQKGLPLISVNSCGVLRSLGMEPSGRGSGTPRISQQLHAQYLCVKQAQTSHELPTKDREESDHARRAMRLSSGHVQGHGVANLAGRTQTCSACCPSNPTSPQPWGQHVHARRASTRSKPM